MTAVEDASDRCEVNAVVGFAVAIRPNDASWSSTLNVTDWPRRFGYRDYRLEFYAVHLSLLWLVMTEPYAFPGSTLLRCEEPFKKEFMLFVKQLVAALL